MSMHAMYPPNQPVSYSFIDGECFNHIIKNYANRYFSGIIPAINWGAVRDGSKKAFYYDALPVPQQGEDATAHAERIEPKRRSLAFIEQQPSFHVRTGDVRHRRKRGNEQKMVDVQLAVDAMSMANKGVFDTCKFITGDLDFKPLMTALVELGLDVHLIYPLGETNDELISSVDLATPADLNMFLRWIESGTPEQARIPSAFFDFTIPEGIPPNARAEFADNRFGRCGLYVLPDGRHNLLTERSPANPSSHRLNMVGSDYDILVKFAEDMFGITLPAQL